MSTGPTTPGRSQNLADHSSTKVFALLHTFSGHIKAVTAIRLHPISGLAISTGMNKVVHIWLHQVPIDTVIFMLTYSLFLM